MGVYLALSVMGAMEKMMNVLRKSAFVTYFVVLSKTYVGGIVCLLFWYVAGIALFIPSLPWLCAMYAARMIEACVFRLLFSAEVLGTDESIWIYDDPKNRSIMNTILEFDGYISEAELRDVVIQRLVDAHDDEGENLYPRVTKRVYAALLNYYLVEESNFRIEDHVYAWSKGKDYSRNELADILTLLSSRDFPRHVSPWEYILIHIRGNGAVQTTAVVFRMHHCLADGISLADLLIRQLPDETVDVPQFEKMTKKASNMLTLKGLFFSPLALLKMLTKKLKRTPIHSSGLSGRKLYAWSEPLDLDLIKDIRLRMKVTVNDILVGCVARAIGNYFAEAKPNSVAGDVLCSIPVDTRISSSEARRLSNKAAFVQVPLPASVIDISEAVYETKRRMDHIKSTGDAFASRFYMRAFGLFLPARIFNKLVLKFTDNAPITVANVPGPRYPVSIAGQRMRFLSFFPPHRGRTTMGVSVFSYAGRYVLGVEADETVVSEPGKICSRFTEAVHELAKSTGVFMTKLP